ncbi:ABC transporter substrate-binding protein [Kitasatospora aureofaciens]|uniref:ABC transporter substrate-binding protein n=1 Tax=Kitasatospora aureofaciens TaxID=1894 RepID=UPI003F4CC120
MGDPREPGADPARLPGPGPQRGPTGYPVTVADCAGKETTIAKAPTRIVTSNAASLEMLLQLGAGDRVIGTGFPPGKGTLPSALAEQGAKAPRTDLAGIEDDIRRLGAVTGTAARAEELVTGMEKRIGEVRTALAGVPEDERPSYFAFDFDAGTKQPVAVCGRQVANAVITQAGARNVFADCDADFKPGSWEDVVAKNPDWIQLSVRNRGSEDATRKAYDDAEAFLRSFPATQGLKAVQEGRFVRLGSEVTTIAGVRNADAVRQIAATVHPDLVKNGQ